MKNYSRGKTPLKHQVKNQPKHQSGNQQTPKGSQGSKSIGSGPLFPRNLRPVVGLHAIIEALKSHPRSIEMVWFRQGWESSKDLQNIHQKYGHLFVKFEVKPAAFLDKLCSTHQGAALFMKDAPVLDFESLENKQYSKIILLDGLEDPHNLGAILRTSWLLEVDGILIPQDRAVGLTATVHKVACGGVEYVPVEVCGNFTNVLDRLKKMGFWVIGLSHLGKGTIFEMNLPEKIVWCIGSEDKGLRVTTERLCDELVRIPQASAPASYNASVAASMALLETYRQHSLKLKQKN